MPTAEIDADALRAAADVIPADSPIVMLNLVRYHAQADYSGHTDQAGCSGQEAYLLRYAPAFNAVAAAEGLTGIEVLYLGRVTAALAAPAEERWDNIVLVKYPSFAAFRTVTESSRYLAEAYPHRKAALADWRLIATSPIALPS